MQIIPSIIYASPFDRSPEKLNRLPEEKQKTIILLWNKIISATNQRQYVEILHYFTELDNYLRNDDDFIGMKLRCILTDEKMEFLTTLPEYQKTLDVLHLLIPEIFSYYNQEPYQVNFSRGNPQDMVNEKILNLQKVIAAIFHEKCRDQSASTQFQFFQTNNIINNYLTRDFLSQYKTLFEEWERLLLVELTDDDKTGAALEKIDDLKKAQEKLTRADTAITEYETVQSIFDKNFEALSKAFENSEVHRSSLSQLIKEQQDLIDTLKNNTHQYESELQNLNAAELDLNKEKDELSACISKLISQSKKTEEHIKKQQGKFYNNDLSPQENILHVKDAIEPLVEITRANEAGLAEIQKTYSIGQVSKEKQRKALQTINIYINKLKELKEDKIKKITDINMRILKIKEKNEKKAQDELNILSHELAKTDNILNELHEEESKREAEKEIIEKEIKKLTDEMSALEEEYSVLKAQNIKNAKIKIKLEKRLEKYEKVHEATTKNLEIKNKLTVSKEKLKDITRRLGNINEKRHEQKNTRYKIENHKNKLDTFTPKLREEEKQAQEAEKKLFSAISDLENTLIAMGYNIKYSKKNLSVEERFHEIKKIAEEASKEAVLDCIENTNIRCNSKLNISSLEEALKNTEQNNANVNIPQHLVLVFRAKTIIDDPNLSVSDKVNTLNKDLNTLKTAHQNTLSQQEISFIKQAGLLLGCLVLVTPIACVISKITRGSWAFWKSDQTIEKTNLCKETTIILECPPVPPTCSPGPAAA